MCIVIVSLGLAAVTVGGAFGSGFYYMKDGWRRVKIEQSRDRCSTNPDSNICVCTNINALDMPSTGKKFFLLQKMQCGGVYF